jgi:hypothetical protein
MPALANVPRISRIKPLIRSIVLPRPFPKTCQHESGSLPLVSKGRPKAQVAGGLQPELRQHGNSCHSVLPILCHARPGPDLALRCREMDRRQMRFCPAWQLPVKIRQGPMRRNQGGNPKRRQNQSSSTPPLGAGFAALRAFHEVRVGCSVNDALSRADRDEGRSFRFAQSFEDDLLP